MLFLITLSFIILPTLSSTVAHDIFISFPMGESIPVQLFSSSEPLLTIHDRVVLDSDTINPVPLLTTPFDPRRYIRDEPEPIVFQDFFVDVDTVLIGGGLSTFRGSVRVPIPLFESAVHSLTMSLRMDSEFLDQVGHFLITPTSSNESLMVINPSNHLDYALERVFVFVPIDE